MHYQQRTQPFAHLDDSQLYGSPPAFPYPSPPTPPTPPSLILSQLSYSRPAYEQSHQEWDQVCQITSCSMSPLTLRNSSYAPRSTIPRSRTVLTVHRRSESTIGHTHDQRQGCRTPCTCQRPHFRLSPRPVKSMAVNLSARVTRLTKISGVFFSFP